MAVATGNEHGLFIDGQTADAASGDLRDLIEPATGATLARAAMAGEADVDRAVGAARAALNGAWGRTPPNERARLLHALADAIRTRSRPIAASSPSSKPATSARRSRRSRQRSPAQSRTSASSHPSSARSPAARIRSAARC
jgi:acyl-CoA reductase-like NAD-dependent aldehyde dehydrogenase